jgi:hypothetical protein
MKQTGTRSGAPGTLARISGIPIIFIAAAVAVVVSTQHAPPSPGETPGTNVCFTSSVGVVELQCGGNKFKGFSFGV